jgi:hypothetical protein
VVSRQEPLARVKALGILKTGEWFGGSQSTNNWYRRTDLLGKMPWSSPALPSASRVKGKSPFPSSVNGDY